MTDHSRTPDNRDARTVRNEDHSTARAHDVETKAHTHDHSTTRAYDVETKTHPDDHSAQEAFIGTSNPHVAKGNVSWGAIFAGVVTFLSIMILLGVGAAAMGLQDSSGTAVGIFTLIGLVIAFLAAGYVAGALGVRGGLFHGFATWATSLIAAVVLAGWLGTSLIGTAGSIVGTAAETGAQATTVDPQQAQDAANNAANNVDPNQVQDSAQQAAGNAQQTLNEAAPAIAEGGWWTFGGLLLGAVLAALAGVAGARSVINKKTHEVVSTQR